MQYSSITSAKSGHDGVMPSIEVTKAHDKDPYGDVLRDGSQEWIMMQDGAQKVEGRRSPV